MAAEKVRDLSKKALTRMRTVSYTHLDVYKRQNPDPAQKAEQERLCRVDPAVPWSIIAITFTNKAAGELKERLERMLGPSANDIWASTFHSCLLYTSRCV